MKVSILLAIYNPNLVWLKEQLISINEQTYKDIELLICDDCSPNVTYELINEIIKNEINGFPVTFYRNRNNLGSTITFSDLAYKAKGEFIAFCDQDDIWEKEKIEMLIKPLLEEKKVLSYCGGIVIDENNNIIDEDWNSMRKHANIGKGNNTYKALLFRNWIAGCFMLVTAENVKKALPFINSTFYDQWVALVASLEGEFVFVDNSLIRYRRHSNTQTGSLAGVNSKQDYMKKYINANFFFINEVKKRISDDNINKSINESLQWCKSREDWWRSFNVFAMVRLFKGLKFDKQVFAFELVMARMPERLFKIVIKYIKQGRL